MKNQVQELNGMYDLYSKMFGRDLTHNEKYLMGMAYNRGYSNGQDNMLEDIKRRL